MVVKVINWLFVLSIAEILNLTVLIYLSVLFRISVYISCKLNNKRMFVLVLEKLVQILIK